MVGRLVIGCTLRNRASAATTAHTSPIHDLNLLGLAAQPVHFTGPSGTGALWSAENWRYASSAPEKKAHHTGLLLPSQPLDVLASTHLGLPDGCGQMESSMAFLYTNSELSAKLRKQFHLLLQ